MLSTILFVLFAYLVGSVSAAIITCKLMGLPDPRTLGSNNPGATNVLRFGGKKAAAITLLGDTLKGVIPVVIARLFDMDALTLALVACAAFLGHLYPVFFAFKGGKGVATAFGVILVVNPWVALGLLVTWLVMAYGLKISSLSALTAAVLAPLYIWLIDPQTEYLAMGFFISAMLIWRHQSNIKNLLSGKEGSIKAKD